jgi:hypothetical protein
MFVQEATLNVGKLMMWRELAESGRLGRRPEGAPSGEIALAVAVQTETPISKIMDRKMQQHLAANGDY